MKFEVGDIVEWCGARGKIKSRSERDIIVIFNSEEIQFFSDGTYMPWHQEPSLKFVERPITTDPLMQLEQLKHEAKLMARTLNSYAFLGTDSQLGLPAKETLIKCPMSIRLLQFNS